MDTNIAIPTISVIMPVYNCANFVSEALESILEQTFPDFEVILIDDHSTDETYSIISAYDDGRIKLIRKTKQSGLIDSLNTGLKMARGKFIARMDGDDVSEPERLKKQVDFFNENPDIILCGTAYRLMHAKDIVINPLEHDEIKIGLLDNCVLGHPTVMFKKNVIDKHSLSYDKAYEAAEDYDLWTRMVVLGRIANLPEPLLIYRVHEGQVTARDQYNQVRNSVKCRVRMLCYPLTKPEAADFTIGESLVRQDTISTLGELKQKISWLDRLLYDNDSTLFFNGPTFMSYIEKRKEQIVRRYYLHHTNYRPEVYFRFWSSAPKFNRYFSTAERFKFLIKCLFYWQ